MSIEIEGFNSSDIPPVQETAQLASQLTREEGVYDSVALTYCRKAAELATAITITALRDMGVIPPEGFDLEDFRRIANAIFIKSKNINKY